MGIRISDHGEVWPPGESAHRTGLYLCSAGDRGRREEFADPPESREHSTAHRPGVAAGGKMVDGDPCGIRHLPGYERVSRDCGSNGAAVAAVEEPQRSEHAVGSLDAGGWIPRFANHHGHDVCNRTALPSGHGAELVVVGAAESVVDDGDDADIPGNQRNARAPAS